MRKLFTLVASALIALTANAKDYTGQMNVALGSGNPTPQEATVAVTESEDAGTYDITLKEFSFSDIPIGDIEITGVQGTAGNDGFISFAETTREVKVLGMNVSVTLNEGSKVSEDKLEMSITITDVLIIGTVTADFDGSWEAKGYSDKMVVTIFGPNPAQDATIYVGEKLDGTYSLSLRDFTASIMGEQINVGTIEIENLTATEENGIKSLSYDGEITIKDGSEGTNWSMVGQTLPITMTAKMNDNKLYAVIDIDLKYMTVNVVFGTDEFTSGISNVTTTTENGVEAIYDLSGRKLNEMQKGINIVRKADGTTVKVLKK